jgi:lipoprotein NlpI
LSLKEFKNSMADITRHIDRHPEDPLGYMGRATVYCRLGDDARALSDYSRALELDPSNAAVYFSRGVYYAEKERYSEMHADLMAALNAGLSGEKAELARGMLLYGVTKTPRKNWDAKALKILAAGRMPLRNDQSDKGSPNPSVQTESETPIR